MLFHHRGSMGDIIYSLPTIIAFGGGTLWLNREPFYRHMKSLLELQPYIEKVVNIVEPQEYINLDLFRPLERNLRFQGIIKHLSEYYLIEFKKEYDLSQSWLTAPKLERAKIVINRTTRYHDKEQLDWTLLKPYQKDILFIGWRGDYRDFSRVSGFKPEFYICKDTLEMASIINGSKLFLGNQSLGFALAEAMKVNRVLEFYNILPNCMPNSSNGYTKLTKELIEQYVNS
jgi:hypothetical protein